MSGAILPRLAAFASWLLGAAIVSIVWWCVTIYLLAEFNRGYGRDTWFLLQLYVSSLAILAGLVGYALVGVVRPHSATFTSALLAGALFGLCQLLFLIVLRRAFPDRDVLVHQLIGALVLGALSTVITLWPHRPR